MLLCALYGESYIFGGSIIHKSMQIDWKHRRHVSHLRTNYLFVNLISAAGGGSGGQSQQQPLNSMGQNL